MLATSLFNFPELQSVFLAQSSWYLLKASIPFELIVSFIPSCHNSFKKLVGIELYSTCWDEVTPMYLFTSGLSMCSPWVGMLLSNLKMLLNPSEMVRESVRCYLKSFRGFNKGFHSHIQHKGTWRSLPLGHISWTAPGFYPGSMAISCFKNPLPPGATVLRPLEVLSTLQSWTVPSLASPGSFVVFQVTAANSVANFFTTAW